MDVNLSGIPTAQAFGEPTSESLFISGVIQTFEGDNLITQSGDFLGIAIGGEIISIAGIPSQEGAGTLSLNGYIELGSISEFISGSPSILLSLGLNGIATQEDLVDSLIVDYFAYDQEIIWGVDELISVTVPVSWDVGLGTQRWYRVQGCCLFPTSQGSGAGISGPFHPGGCDVSNFESTDSKCIGAGGKQLFIQNVLATSVGDVCRQLNKYNMKWQICSMQVYSNPAGPSQDSCNRLIDVPISSYPECIEVSLQTNALVEIKFTDKVYRSFRYEGSGSVDASGSVLPTGASSVSGYVYPGSGGLVYGGTGEITSSWKQLLEVEADFNFDVIFIEALAAPERTSSTLSGAVKNISTVCGNCTAIPSILYSYLNVDKSYVLSRFIAKNSVAFPDHFPMYYNSLLRSWMSNYQVSGYGDSGEERWNFVFSWTCLNQKAEEPSTPYWKYSIFVNRSLPHIDFDTRVNIIFPPEELCRLIDNLSIDFSFSLNTITNYVENSLVDVTDYVVLTDGIGLFKDSNWAADPWLDVRLSRLLLAEQYETIDLSPIIP